LNLRLIFGTGYGTLFRTGLGTGFQAQGICETGTKTKIYEKNELMDSPSFGLIFFFFLWISVQNKQVKNSITILALRASLKCFMKFLRNWLTAPSEYIPWGTLLKQICGTEKMKTTFLVCPRPLESKNNSMGAALYSKF